MMINVLNVIFLHIFLFLFQALCSFSSAQLYWTGWWFRGDNGLIRLIKDNFWINDGVDSRHEDVPYLRSMDGRHGASFRADLQA